MVKMKRAIDILVGLSMWDSFMLFGTVAVPMDDGTNGWVKNMQNANINHTRLASSPRRFESVTFELVTELLGIPSSSFSFYKFSQSNDVLRLSNSNFSNYRV